MTTTLSMSRGGSGHVSRSAGRRPSARLSFRGRPYELHARFCPEGQVTVSRLHAGRMLEAWAECALAAAQLRRVLHGELGWSLDALRRAHDLGRVGRTLVEQRRLFIVEPPRSVRSAGGVGATRDRAVETAAPPRHWIRIDVVDTDGAPLRNVRYELELPNGGKRTGVTSDEGRIDLRGIDPGACELRLPHLDAGTWR